MPWQVKVNPDMPVIETYYIGQLNPDELNDAVKETIVQAYAHNIILFLGDCTALTGGHSVFDLYNLASHVSESSNGKSIKEAILLPELPTQKESVLFWETTCLNRGLQVRIFGDRKSALDWLLGKTDP
jgi:hypothetical protein